LKFIKRTAFNTTIKSISMSFALMPSYLVWAYSREFKGNHAQVKMIFLFIVWNIVLFCFSFFFLHAWWVINKNGKLILEKCVFVCVFCVHVSRLDQEYGLLFNLKYFEEKILAGDWDECAKYLNGFRKKLMIIDIRSICSLRLGSRSILNPWTGSSLHL